MVSNIKKHKNQIYHQIFKRYLPVCNALKTHTNLILADHNYRPLNT